MFLSSKSLYERDSERSCDTEDELLKIPSQEDNSMYYIFII